MCVDYFFFYQPVMAHAACSGLEGRCSLCLEYLPQAEAVDPYWVARLGKLSVPLNLEKYQRCRRRMEYAGFLFAPDAALAAHPAEETHWQKPARVPEGAVRIAKPDLDSSFMDRSDSVRGRVLHYSTRKTHVLATEILYLTGIPDKSQFCSAMGATISFDHLLQWS